MELNHYRHELKYRISYADYLALRQRLRPVMKPDTHAGSDGTYTVRSVYFDNYRDKALLEKLNGVQKREKWRLRYYNDDWTYMVLEKKCKHNALCLKLDAPLTEQESRLLISGDRTWMKSHPSSLVQELYCKLITQQLQPRVMVSYEREAYTYPPGNVRVTFDKNIRTTLFHRGFLEEQVLDMGAEEEPGMVLEVKYDDFLPEIIENLLQSEDLRQQAFSKYGLCRRFG